MNDVSVTVEEKGKYNLMIKILGFNDFKWQDGLPLVDFKNFRDYKEGGVVLTIKQEENLVEYDPLESFEGEHLSLLEFIEGELGDFLIENLFKAIPCACNDPKLLYMLKSGFMRPSQS